MVNSKAVFACANDCLAQRKSARESNPAMKNQLLKSNFAAQIAKTSALLFA
jgi:hypothetical protein